MKIIFDVFNYFGELCLQFEFLFTLMIYLCIVLKSDFFVSFPGV